jgi:hypothetical protein
MRNEQEAEMKIGGLVGHPDGRTYTHPAFAQIGASRSYGGGFAHYGSDFRHDATIEIRIARSELNRDLSRDWHFEKEQLIVVRLSEAQWATFVSTLNNGSGVTCTIDHVAGEQAPGIALRNERDVVENEFVERTKRVAAHLSSAISEIDAELAGLSKAKREKILERMRQAHREVSDSMPFAAKSFAEHVETTVEKAKIEVEAYVHGRIVSAGLKAIGATSPLQMIERVSHNEVKPGG